MTIIKIRWAPNRQNDALIGRYLVDQLWSLASLDVINVEQIYWFFNQMHTKLLEWFVQNELLRPVGTNTAFRFVSMKSHSRRSKTGSNRMASKILTWFQITWNAIDIKFFRSQTVILNPVTFLKSQRFFCSCSRRRRTWYYMSRMHVDIDRYHTNASKTQPATVCSFVILLLLLFTSYMLLFNAWHSNRVHCNRSLQFSSSYKSKSINKNKSLFLMFIN